MGEGRQKMLIGVQPAASSPTVHLAVNSSGGYDNKSSVEKHFGSLTDTEVTHVTPGNNTSVSRKASSLASEKREGTSSKQGSRLSLTNSAAKLSNLASTAHQSSRENVWGREQDGGTMEGSHSRSSSPKGSKSDKGSEKGASTGGQRLSGGSMGGQPGGANVGRVQSAAASIKKIIAPNYKSRNEEFKKLFKKVPEGEKFVIDYSCAFQKEILHQGRMYLSQGSVCFYANIFGKWETNIVIKLREISSVTKEKTAKVIPNAIQIATRNGEKYFFTSFATRDKSYMMIFKMWQSALLDQVISPQDLWAWAQHGYDIDDLPASDMDSDPLTNGLSNDENALLSSSLDGPLPSESLPVFTVGSPDSDDMQSAWAESPIVETPGSKGRERSAPVLATEGGNHSPRVVKRRKPVAGGQTGKTKSARSAVAQAPMTSTPAADNFSESSENDVELTCPCSVHDGQELINKVYPLSVDQMFILMFTDSVFYRSFHESRKSTDLELGEWRVDRDGVKTRNVSYTMCLNHSMAPKTAGVSEKQTCNQHGKSGQVYVLRVEAQNLGIPYADSFYVSSVYCLSRVSATECRVRCHGTVVFKKSLWGIVKSFIETNSLRGMQEHFDELDKYLRQECLRLGLPSDVETPEPRRAGPQKRHVAAARTRERRHSLRAEQQPKFGARPLIGQGRQYGGYSGTTSYLPPEIEWIAKGILIMMVVMLLLNGLLFYKLWMLESDAEAKQKSNEYYSTEDLKYLLEKSELSTDDLLRLYKSHQELAAQRWLTALQGTITSLSHIEEELQQLRQKLNSAQTEFSFFGTESQRLKERKGGEGKKSEEL